MISPDSPLDAEKLWAEMLDSVRSILDTVKGAIEPEQYSDSLKKVLVESMQLALEGLKDLKDVAAHLPVDKRMPAIEELKTTVERTTDLMADFKAWAIAG
jgi:non-homologous end joining protein Ku